MMRWRANELRNQVLIPRRERVQPAVEPKHEAIAGGLGSVNEFVRQHRSQRHRGKQRDADRSRHRQRELLVEQSGRSRQKRDRDEHRHQDQRRGDDGAADLLHRAFGRLKRIGLVVDDMAHDILQHDDRVVDHQSRRERQAEERQRVDRKVHQLHRRKRTDQRNRDRDRRDQRAVPVLQEDEDDQDDQQNRDQQRDDDFFDRRSHEVRGVEGDLVVHAGGNRLRDARHRRADVLRNLQRVCGRLAFDGEHDRRLAVVSRGGDVVLRAQLDVGDVA